MKILKQVGGEGANYRNGLPELTFIFGTGYFECIICVVQKLLLKSYLKEVYRNQAQETNRLTDFL